MTTMEMETILARLDVIEGLLRERSKRTLQRDARRDEERQLPPEALHAKRVELVKGVVAAYTKRGGVARTVDIYRALVTQVNMAELQLVLDDLKRQGVLQEMFDPNKNLRTSYWASIEEVAQNPLLGAKIRSLGLMTQGQLDAELVQLNAGNTEMLMTFNNQNS